ncbi:MAG TPA: asparagine synthase (glutamine-hydrolyzing) [Methylomirabilota bacterium]|nr:asparagine synthase (glutamine-hydrolyzing) [Methylomirabilota bacterium]
MCGITGWIAPRGVDADLLRRMTDAVAHRGPDGEGFYVSPDGVAGLGHRRLAIVDVAGGRQPIGNEDGTVWVVANGEIYNFRALRETLQARGHRFATGSDTEVIVHAYEDEGEGCLARLHGMFAFALYDARRRRLLLARDRFGKKPLHWAMAGDDLVFGSEIPSLLHHPRLARRLDRRALARYLAYEYVPSPHTIYEGIHKLPPASWMTYDLDSRKVQRGRYHHLRFPAAPVAIDEREAAQALLDRLREAVRDRLMSEVPLGVLLSGGIDSSAIVALMADLVPPARIETFTIAFREPAFDESGAARQVARWIGTAHHEEVFDIARLHEVLPDVAAVLAEPFADPSVLPTYLLARFARRRVTVALGGDGGDELLAGYPTFLAARHADRYARLPGLLRAAVARAVDALPAAPGNFTLDFKVRQFLRGVAYAEPRRTQVWLGAFAPAEIPAVLSDAVNAELDGFDPLEDLDRLWDAEHPMPADVVDRASDQHVATYLTDDILAKVDRASMACALEVRAPFLDHRVAELAVALPASLKLRGRSGKYLLKRALRGRLPEAILQRPKQGFGIPTAQWLRDDLLPLVREHLDPDRVRAQGLFRPERVQALLDEHRRGRRNHRKPLWTLLMFQLWAARFGAGV